MALELWSRNYGDGLSVTTPLPMLPPLLLLLLLLLFHVIGLTIPYGTRQIRDKDATRRDATQHRVATGRCKRLSPYKAV